MLNSKARNLAEVNLREILSDKQITSEMLIKKEKKKKNVLMVRYHGNHQNIQ